MSQNDMLRVLRHQALAIRRSQIAQTLGLAQGQGFPKAMASASRLPALRRLIAGLDAALKLPAEPAPARARPPRA